MFLAFKYISKAFMNKIIQPSWWTEEESERRKVIRRKESLRVAFRVIKGQQEEWTKERSERTYP